MARKIIQRQVTRYACDLCKRSEDSSNWHRPYGWRTVIVTLDREHLFIPLPEHPEVACSNRCIADFVLLFEPTLVSKWTTSVPANEPHDTPSCESCLRPRDNTADWRRLGIQLCSEDGWEAFAATGGAAPFGSVPLVCSPPCAVALLRSCAKRILDENVDRLTSDRDFVRPRSDG